MVLIGLGANLSSKIGGPRATLEAALTRMSQLGVIIEQQSSWYRTSPVPASDQPDFVNAVASVRTELPPEDLLKTLRAIEIEFGRVRQEKWEARAIDLDLLAYDDLQILETPQTGEQTLQIPHPRLQERRFVLQPLAEIAPLWVHPTLGKTARELLAELGGEESCEALG